LPELPLRKSLSEQFHLLLELGRWIPVSAFVGVMAGSALALLRVARFRYEDNPPLQSAVISLCQKELACPSLLAF